MRSAPVLPGVLTHVDLIRTTIQNVWGIGFTHDNACHSLSPVTSHPKIKKNWIFADRVDFHKDYTSCYDSHDHSCVAKLNPFFHGSMGILGSQKVAHSAGMAILLHGIETVTTRCGIHVLFVDYG